MQSLFVSASLHPRLHPSALIFARPPQRAARNRLTLKACYTVYHSIESPSDTRSYLAIKRYKEVAVEPLVRLGLDSGALSGVKRPCKWLKLRKRDSSEYESARYESRRRSRLITSAASAAGHLI